MKTINLHNAVIMICYVDADDAGSFPIGATI